MSCTEILNIIGNIASIFTVLGGVYGFCKWIKSRKATLKVENITHSDQAFYYVDILNEGPADAYNIKINGASAYIPNLQPGEKAQLSFACWHPLSLEKLTLHWTDKMGSHSKRISLNSLI